MATDTPRECAAQMLRLLTAQRDLFAEIREQAEKQLTLIEAGDADALLRLLVQKQRLIDRNEAVNAELEPIRVRWDAVRDHAGPELRGPVEAAMTELRAHLTAVIDLENQAKTRAQGTQSETTAQVGKMQTGKAMLKAYGARPGAAPVARFQDKNG